MRATGSGPDARPIRRWRAQEHIGAGFAVVVDLDLEKFFDRVNHDVLMGLVAQRVTDKRILRLIRGFLTAGVLTDGLVEPMDEGTPQGGPLSPLLSNLMLDVLDKELERRGHRFVRYADDCNIYVRSTRAGERVMVEPAQVPGLQLHGRITAEAAHRAPGPGPLQGESSGTDALRQRGQPRADCRRAVALPHPLARLFRLL